MREVVPYKDLNTGKKEQVALMFDNISNKYDQINRIMTFGIDISWRKKALRELKALNPRLILDVATGTGDFAVMAMQMLSPDHIIGVDISEGMLQHGQTKLKKLRLEEKITLLKGDSEKLPFEDNKFDAITVSYGVRNFEDLQKGLSEILRVLKPQGKLVVLEATEPNNSFIKALFDLYAKKMVPFIGRIISGDSRAYSYLQESVAKFPQGKQFKSILDSIGFVDTKVVPLTFGASTIYTGCKR